MSPPLTPSADEARRQLIDELSKPIYIDPTNWILELWKRLLEWLSGGVEAAPSVGLSPGQLSAIVIAVLLLVAIIVGSMLGPIRRRRREREDAVLFDEDFRTAEQLRTDAVRLAEAGDWTTASLTVFRAMIRTLAERGTIEEFGGMTAHEGSEQAAQRLPDLAARLESAAQLFDSLAYGRRTASAEQYRMLLALDTEACAAVPTPLATQDAPEAITVETVS